MNHIGRLLLVAGLSTAASWNLFNAVRAWAVGEEPATVHVQWPPYVPDCDPTTPGDQPGYDLNAPNNYDQGHTAGEKQVRLHVKPGKGPGGVKRKVCDVHIVTPPGMKGSANEGVVVQALAGWAGGKRDVKTGDYHFHSPGCAHPMEEEGLTFGLWSGAGKMDNLQNVKVLLTDDGTDVTPAANSVNIVGALYMTDAGHPIQIPFTAMTLRPLDPPLGETAGRVLASIGATLPLAIDSVHGDGDYELFASRSKDLLMTDPSDTGVNAVNDPLPQAWGIAFVRGEHWLNSFGEASEGIVIPALPLLKGKEFYITGTSTLPGGLERTLAQRLHIYVVHSAVDYDGDGEPNGTDAEPFNPEVQ